MALFMCNNDDHAEKIKKVLAFTKKKSEFAVPGLCQWAAANTPTGLCQWIPLVGYKNIMGSGNALKICRGQWPWRPPNQNEGVQASVSNEVAMNCWEQWWRSTWIHNQFGKYAKTVASFKKWCHGIWVHSQISWLWRKTCHLDYQLFQLFSTCTSLVLTFHHQWW